MINVSVFKYETRTGAATLQQSLEGPVPQLNPQEARRVEVGRVTLPNRTDNWVIRWQGTVDNRKQVTESNESDNSGSGECIIFGTTPPPDNLIRAC
jgi:hypothetical protein